jgi:hypothetical protein
MSRQKVIPVTVLTSEQKIYLWLRSQRGLCSKVAREHGVSREFVRKVLYGLSDARSADLRIERSLAEAGAPFMKDRLERESGVVA